MMEEIEWLRSTSQYIAEYYEIPFLETLEMLTEFVSGMREQPHSTWTSFQDHILMKNINEDFSTEWMLARKISSLEEFTDESQSLAYRYTDEVKGLYTPLDHPDPLW